MQKDHRKNNSDNVTAAAHPYDVLAEYYDFFGRPDDEDAVLDFIRATCFKDSKTEFADLRILDWGCGTGRLSCRLAQEGAAVTALDLSPAMLAQAVERWEAVRDDVRHPILFVESDILTEIPFEAFDMVIAATDVLNHFSADALAAVFQRAASMLKPSGLFIFDILQPDFLIKERGDNTFYCEGEGDPPEFTLVWENIYNPLTSVAISDLTIYTLEGNTYRRNVDRIIEYAHRAGHVESLADADFMLEAKHDVPERIYYAYKKRE